MVRHFRPTCAASRDTWFRVHIATDQRQVALGSGLAPSTNPQSAENRSLKATFRPHPKRESHVVAPRPKSSCVGQLRRCSTALRVSADCPKASHRPCRDPTRRSGRSEERVWFHADSARPPINVSPRLRSRLFETSAGSARCRVNAPPRSCVTPLSSSANRRDPLATGSKCPKAWTRCGRPAARRLPADRYTRPL